MRWPKSLAGWLVLLFILWFIVQQPANASHLADQMGKLLTQVANGLGNFVGRL